MKRKEVESLFTLAGFEILAMKALIDGYGYEPDDERFTQTLPRCAWWFVKTKFGWIEIGWRKHVISIDWKDTAHRGKLTEEQYVTSEDTYVHCGDIPAALKRLTQLRSQLDPVQVMLDKWEEFKTKHYLTPA